jgi:hypothetical protein
MMISYNEVSGNTQLHFFNTMCAGKKLYTPRSGSIQGKY